MNRERLASWWSSAVEGPGWLETTIGIVTACGAWLFGRYGDLDVRDHSALYGGMTTVSVGLMTVSAIVVNLSSALSLRTRRLAQSPGAVATASFAAVSALLTSTGVGLVLLAFDEAISRDVRYALVGIWVGLVIAASARSLALGRRILIATLRARVAEPP